MADAAMEDKSEESEDSGLDCPICLQTAVHPVELPCSHIFCYLCIKGISNPRSGGRCAICRTDFPYSVLLNPRLKDESQLEVKSLCKSFQWFYESRSGGWWMYDERTMTELEDAYEAGRRTCQVLIAGHMYEIDFIRMIQFRTNNPAWSRRIKRDQPNLDETRGVAGIRLQRDGNPGRNQSQPLTQPQPLTANVQHRPPRSRVTARVASPPNQVPPSQQVDDDNQNVRVHVVPDDDQIVVTASVGATSNAVTVTTRSPYMTRRHTRSSARSNRSDSSDDTGIPNQTLGNLHSNGPSGNVNSHPSPLTSSSDVTSVRITTSSHGSPSSATSAPASLTCLLIGSSVQLTFDTTDNNDDIL